MKIRIKETGELLEDVKFIDTTLHKITIQYLDDGVLRECSIKNLSDIEEVKDYEEPKEYWFIDAFGNIVQNEITKHYGDEYTDMTNEYENQKQIGNYFETKEEAEKAVEKLKAWKRLKDKGFRFTITPGVGSLDVDPDKFQIEINADMPAKWFCCDAVQKDLDACFGGEE